jgi:uroporphyrinogen decarboxylase
VFEAAWYLTGMEKFLMGLANEEDYVFALMDRIMAYSIGVGKELLKLEPDIIWLGDDMGTQAGMLISPALWRRHIKPRLAGVIRSLRAADPTVKIAYHCCGSFYPIIPELIDIGIDILNALQPAAKDMELARLKREYGQDVCLWGGIDIQQIMPFGTMEEIEGEVKRVLAAAAPGGGYLLAGAHNIQPDTSAQKVVALFRCAREYGRYPLSEL